MFRQFPQPLFPALLIPVGHAVTLGRNGSNLDYHVIAFDDSDNEEIAGRHL
jgi:hypothetical protein